MTGYLQSDTISVELAFMRPTLFLAYSITAICIPKQIPRKGTLFNLAYEIAMIFPSIPLSPNPGATISPSKFSSFSFKFLDSKYSECKDST